MSQMQIVPKKALIFKGFREHIRGEGGAGKRGERFFQMAQGSAIGKGPRVHEARKTAEVGGKV